jgi:hypothetical protein
MGGEEGGVQGRRFVSSSTAARAHALLTHGRQAPAAAPAATSSGAADGGKRKKEAPTAGAVVRSQKAEEVAFANKPSGLDVLAGEAPVFVLGE